MANTNFIDRMKPVWDELADLTARARRGGVRSLSAEELARLDSLYRLSTVHLAQLQSRSQNQALIENLNRLVAQAHSLVYVSPKQNPLMRIVRFYLTGFPRAVVRTAPYQLTALALLIIGTIAGWYISANDTFAAYNLIIPDAMRLPGSSQEQLESVLRSGRDGGTGEKFFFMSFLLTHNTKVGFTAFASGILAGIPTLYIMLYTGAFLGAFTAVHAEQNITSEWWAWILPHGITEIGACVLCGGAGLMLGMAVLRPRYQTRRASLVAAGKEGLYIALGVVPMFIFAGFAESFVRQSHWTTETRFYFAAVTAAFWVLYFASGWMAERRARAYKLEAVSD